MARQEEEIMTGIRQRAGGMTRMRAGVPSAHFSHKLDSAPSSGTSAPVLLARWLSLVYATSMHPILYHVRPTFHFTVPSRLTRCPHISVPTTLMELFHGVVKMLTNSRFTDWDAGPIASIKFMDRKYAHLLAGRDHLRSPTPTPNGSCIIPFAGKPTW